MQIRSRSGLAARGIVVMNQPGTIDSDYEGEIKVMLMNNTTKVWFVSEGARIAQGVLSPIAYAVFVPAEPVIGTERGASGFGSTGSD